MNGNAESLVPHSMPDSPLASYIFCSNKASEVSGQCSNTQSSFLLRTMREQTAIESETLELRVCISMLKKEE